MAARVMGEARPELQAQFQLPAKPSDALLLTVARQFGKNAAPLEAEFVGHGISPADLQAAIDAFEEALRDRGMGQDERVAARASITTALSDARAAVRKLDVIVANHPAISAAVREVWKRDRRIDPGRSRKAPQPADAVETPAPVVNAPPERHSLPPTTTPLPIPAWVE